MKTTTYFYRLLILACLFVLTVLCGNPLYAQLRMGDNLGTHKATKALDMNSKDITNVALLKYKTLDVGDVATGGYIGAAAATVDLYTAFLVTQSTAGQTLTLPTPTTPFAGKVAYVKNMGSASFSLYGATVADNVIVQLVWNGRSWAVAESPITVVNSTNLFSTGLTGTGSAVTSTYQSIFLGQDAGNRATRASYSNFIGNSAGAGAADADNSNFVGTSAGNDATFANSSNFFGNNAGSGAVNAMSSNMFGSGAGTNARYAGDSNFLGFNAGAAAENATKSNFFGNSAGANATYAGDSNFFGFNAGQGAEDASNSNLFGYQVGKSFIGNNIGSNNIIIGTNISLPDGTADAINLGGVLFGSETNFQVVGDPLIAPVSGGKIGIGVVSPTATLHLKAGIASTAPLKLTAGTNLTATEAGAVEYDGSHFYATTTNGRQLLDNSVITGVGAGTAQAQTLASGVTALVNGTTAVWMPIASNTAAAPTLAVGTSTATAITKSGATALTEGDIVANVPATAIYNGTNWVLQNPQTAAAASVALHKITAATATNTIDNAANTQTWNWSTATTETPLSMNFNGLTTGTGLALATTGAAALNSTDGLFSVKNTSALTNGKLATFQANSTTGSGMTILTNGNIGIGTTAPHSFAKLEVTGNIFLGQSGVSHGISGYLGASNDWYALSPNAYVNSGVGWYYLKNGYAGNIVFIDGGWSFETYGANSSGDNATLNTVGGERMTILNTGNVGIGTTAPTAVLHLKAGTDAASTAPLKLTAGTNLTTTEAGAVEYDGSHLYFTAADAGTRYQLDGSATTLTAPSGTNANGGSILGNTLMLSFADGTNPGLMSTGAQTFAGVKTFTNNIAVNGGSLTTTAASANLFNTVVTTLNIGNTATTLTMGNVATGLTMGGTTGTTTIRNTLKLLNGNITSGNSTSNLFNSGVTILNIGGDATDITMGASTGTTVVNNNLQVKGGTFALGDGSGTTAGNIALYDASASSTSITLQSPAALSASYSLTLPDADGAAGQVLKTDGAGNLSWANSESIASKTADYTLTATDNTIVSSNAATITLPAASGLTGKIFRLVSGGGTSTISGSMVLTGGTLSSYGLNTSDGGRGIVVQSNGLGWIIISRF
jgi:hypothetical protein